MSASVDVVGYPRGVVSAQDLAELDAAVQRVSQGWEWGCEPFQVVGQAGAEHLDLSIKILQSDDTNFDRDFEQCLALTVFLSRLRPHWRWTFADEIDVLGTQFGVSQLDFQGGRIVEQDYSTELAEYVADCVARRLPDEGAQPHLAEQGEAAGSSERPASPARPRVSKHVAGLLGAEQAGHSVDASELRDQEVVRQLVALLEKKWGDGTSAEALRAMLGRSPPALVASAGLALFNTKQTPAYVTFEVLYRALLRVDDIEPLIPALISAWCSPPVLDGYGLRRFRGDILGMPDLFCRAADHPTVVGHMQADVERADKGRWDDHGAYIRAASAIEVLARSRTDRALHYLLQLIRGHRGLTHDAERHAKSYLFNAAHESLGKYGDARVFATLLHDLGTMASASRHHDAELLGIVRLDRVRARPYVMRAADLGLPLSVLVEALATIGGDDAIQRLKHLAAQGADDVRESARSALAAAEVDESTGDCDVEVSEGYRRSAAAALRRGADFTAGGRSACPREPGRR
jgi:hypothetical protein